MATTIRELAAAAGVSVATASRALSGSSAVAPATSAKVLRVASELEFTPSRLGRSLATGSTGNIGVIMPDVTNPFYTSFLAELESALGAREIGLLIGDSHENPDLERLLIQRMTSQVDALVLASSRLDDGAIAAAAARLPVVLANRMLDEAAEMPELLAQITVDVDPGFTEAIHHLHAMGHRAVAYIDGPSHSWSGRQKLRVVARNCAELGMRLTTVVTERPDFAAGRDAAVDLLASGETPTAIVAFNDQVALGVLSSLRESGLAVPGDISVVGCDDSLPTGMAWPSLTTVDSSSRTLGALTASAILDQHQSHRGTVSTTLVVRESTGPARSPHRAILRPTPSEESLE
jgi:LacI family transcriptional regulator